MALERAGMKMLRLLQVAQLQRVGVLEVDAILVGNALDQDAIGPAVADVEHEIDLDRPGARLGVDEAHLARLDRLAERLEEDEVAGQRLEATLVLVGAHRSAAPLDMLEFLELPLDPVAHPKAVILAAAVGSGIVHEPVEVAEAADEAELPARPHMELGRRGEGKLATLRTSEANRLAAVLRV